MGWKRWKYEDYDSGTWAACGSLFVLLTIGAVWIATARGDLAEGLFLAVISAAIAIQSFVYTIRMRDRS